MPSIRVRKSLERGHANHGWLNSYHTFSFASYYDPKFPGFSNLRVINEDRVSANRGFGLHPHEDFEIFSYIVSGSLKHNDSMGNEEILKRGEVQFTSAGSGIAHSEVNPSKTEPVHFIQIWVEPWAEGLKPSYHTMKFTDDEKRNKLVPIVVNKSSAAELKAIPLNQDAFVYATLLGDDAEVKHNISSGRRLYVHVIQTGGSITIRAEDGTEVVLNEGDGAFVENAASLTLKGKAANNPNKESEVLLFDLK